ncbi:protein patched-like [Varroa destructor]|uniref:SSD domain-containing protein n=2 Tax=Varroa TaxID=62624 RepID=A0A7M7J3V1_VARDE|nr:protein patched-like [Varroa destructor]
MPEHDSNGFSSLQKVERDLLTRTSWTDACTAYREIQNGRAEGNLASLWVRQHLQDILFRLGCTIQKHPGKILFVGLLTLTVLSVGLKSVGLEYELDKVWTEEGGRIQRELKQLQDQLEFSASGNEQVIIQTASSGGNLLHHEGLLAHVELLRQALQVEVELFDYKWGLADICVKPTAPSFGPSFVDKLFENIMPCEIVTPLSCFWEGSKLTNPWYSMNSDTLGIENLSWLNLNPVNLSKIMKKSMNAPDFPFERMDNFMSRAGITTAYQEKPCLNPYDDLCPDTTPNKKSRSLPDIGATLTGGCYGFASKYIHWPEALTIGGIQRDRSGVVVSAAALRTIVQIMDNKEMFEFHRDTHYSHDIGWSIESAGKVIEAWQNQFNSEMKRLSNLLPEAQTYRFTTFTFNALTNALHRFTIPDVYHLVTGSVVILAHECAAVVFVKQSGGWWRLYVGLFGVVLHGFSISAGLGLCGVLQLAFNATTTRVLPFLALSFGGNSMFLLVHTLNRIITSGAVPVDRQIGECMKRTGMVIVISNASVILAFAAASVIPISALRHFSWQGAIVHACSATSIFFLFPAACSIELYRKRSPVHHERTAHSARRPRPESSAGTAVPAYETPQVSDHSRFDSVQIPRHEIEQVRREESPCIVKSRCCRWSLTQFVIKGYNFLIFRPVMRSLLILSLVGLLMFGCWGVFYIENGIKLTDVIPAHTEEYEYLRYHERYFGTYRIFAITQADFDYPSNQSLLYEYYNALKKVKQIVKNEHGDLPGFWLTYFRKWLIELQELFDKEWKSGHITAEGWTANASQDGILAYKLLVQTGLADTPVDKQLLPRNRLVDSQGVINPKPFYNYLTAWYNHDALGYTLSRGSLVPQPRYWRDTRTTTKDTKDLTIAKSSAIEFAQMPFYLHDLCSTSTITAAVARVRSISDKFQERGLPNFPSGLPFIYWEQYLHLRFYLASAVAFIFVAISVVLVTVLLNVWTTLLIVLLLGVSLVQVFGAMHALGIALNAVPAVLAVVSTGLGMESMLCLCVGFLTALGSTKKHRTTMALEYMITPLTCSTINKLISVILLAFSEFDFVSTYFSCLLSAIVAIYAYNSFVVLPVLLSVIGPSCELVPHNNPNQIDTPSMQSSPELELRASSPATHSFQHHSILGSNYQIHPDRGSSEVCQLPYPRHSLSTISEERTSCRTTSPGSALTPTGVVILPEITVETTIVRSSLLGQVTTSSSESTDGETQSTSGAFRVPLNKGDTTKVKTRAKMKLKLPAMQ